MKTVIAAVSFAMVLVASGGEAIAGEYGGVCALKPRAAAPRFEDFPVAGQFNGKPAAVKLTSREARRYRTMIRDGAREGPNFAGRYTIAVWGCGAGCVQFAIADAKTGVVFMPPFYVGARALKEVQSGEPDEPLQFRANSKLLIVTGSRNDKGGGVYYYKWDGKRLVLMGVIKSGTSYP